MKCSNGLCEKTFDDPILTVNVGDLKEGAYWGIYCSHQCAMDEVAGLWAEIIAGGHYDTFKKKQDEQKKAAEEAAANQVAPQAILNADNVADGVPGLDNNEWGAVVPAEAGDGNLEAANDPVLNIVNATNSLTKGLVNGLAQKYNVAKNLVNIELEVNGQTYKFVTGTITVKPKFTNLEVQFVPSIVNGIKPVLDIIPSGDDTYRLQVDPSVVNAGTGLAPVINHLHGVDAMENNKQNGGVLNADAVNLANQ